MVAIAIVALSIIIATASRPTGEVVLRGSDNYDGKFTISKQSRVIINATSENGKEGKITVTLQLLPNLGIGIIERVFTGKWDYPEPRLDHFTGQGEYRITVRELDVKEWVITIKPLE